MKYRALLDPYNFWWNEPESAFKHLPSFHRPIFHDIYRGLQQIPQIISITGPRRVGKSTLIKQIIRRLIDEGTDPENLIYYSMDDPALYRAEIDHDDFFDSLLNWARKKAGTSSSNAKGSLINIFLDEIQWFERWELFLKKYYDLKYPVRFVISGSASSPIFKKSRESLLGRIKDYHLLPFSFREFLLYRNIDDPSINSLLDSIHESGKALIGMIARHPDYADLDKVSIPSLPEELHSLVDSILQEFFIEGGFPEVWNLPDWEAKQSYLFSNQIEKVIMEDLVLAVELRKPEQLKRFYISLLENPGVELNFTQLSKKIGVNKEAIEKYFPLLEMTDLIKHIEKYKKSPIRVRRGNIKTYLVDLALRNAILRLRENLLIDPTILGLYAENLVFNVINKWEGKVNITYYREKDYEVDFIVHLGASDFLPIEVKYQNHIKSPDLKGIKSFQRRFKSRRGIVVTKAWDQFGIKGDLFYIPLPLFLILFD